MISHLIPESQDLQQLNEMKASNLFKKAQSLFENLKQQLPKVAFDNKTVSSFGSLTFLDKFKKFIDFKDIISETVTFDRGHNTLYSDFEIIDYMIDCNLVGNHRFFHYNDVASDPGYNRIKDNNLFPDESTCRKFLDKVADENIEQLKKVNAQLLENKSQFDSSRQVWLSIDDSVSELYGKQENGAFGYNPKRKGAPSYKLKVSFIQETDELVNISLHSGKVHSSGFFTEFFEQTIQNIPDNVEARGLLVDRGFFSEETCEFLEQNEIKYFMKAKMYSSLKKHALSIPEDKWNSVSSKHCVAEKTSKLDSWESERRFIFIRKEISDKDESQLALPGMEKSYEYQAIVTNTDRNKYSPEEGWHKYNQRATVENKIKEIKNGFAVDQNSQQNFLKNYADVWICCRSKQSTEFS